jgi:hypothetical protein
MKFRKTIKIFLIDGEPNGRLSCELSNWTGKAYKIPRIKLKDCSDRPDLFNPGIYLLFGKDDDANDHVYIGEAESILKRLNQQLSQRDFWNETIIFVSKDENLNKAHIKYLESRLYNLAKRINRYVLDNSTEPTLPLISEPDQSEMEEYIENIKLLVNTLGHKLFDEKRDVGVLEQKEGTFFIKTARGADAQGEPTSDGFVVFKGSKFAQSTVDSFQLSLQKHRQRLIDQGLLIENSGEIELSDDYIFTSPSAAAAIVMGRNANGLTEWKLQDGTTLKEYETTID